MTVIRATLDGGRCSIRAQGHATGSPVVCAGVSALLCALSGYLANRERGGVFYNKTEPGDAVFAFSADPEAMEAVRCVLIGLLQIQLSHPDFLHVEADQKIFSKNP